mgnify:CR=1 FL=1
MNLLHEVKNVILSNLKKPSDIKIGIEIENIIYNDKNKRISIKSIEVKPGSVKSNCFIIDEKLAYISDVNKIYYRDYKYFKNLKYLILLVQVQP